MNEKAYAKLFRSNAAAEVRHCGAKDRLVN